MLRLFRISLSFPFQAFVVDPTNSSVIRSSIAVAVVVVTVTDRNDNGPVFLSSEYTASVSEAAQTGHIVLTSVEATDVDLVRSRAFQTIIAFLLLCQLGKKRMVLHGRVTFYINISSFKTHHLSLCVLHNHFHES